jgi:hypothetical protein
MPRTKSLPPVTGENPAITGPRAPADRLFRTAAECVRQRERYASLVAAGVSEDEQRAALRIACLCDEILLNAVGAFEGVSTNGATKDEEWYRRAIALWHAGREYQRRHGECDRKTRKISGQTPSELAELALEYDLEASALLALQHAVAAYRKIAPDAVVEVASNRPG